MTPAVKALEAAGIPFEVSDYERPGDGERHDFGRDAADALDLPYDQIFKTLIVKTDRDELVVAVVPASCQLSLKSVAAAIGAKKAAMCEPSEAERSSGYVVGGISPFGQRKPLRTVVDDSAVLFDTMHVSGGRRGLDIGLAPQDLIDLLDATVADVSA